VADVGGFDEANEATSNMGAPLMGSIGYEEENVNSWFLY